MKIAVIGSDGFIGRAVFEALKADHIVLGVTRDSYSYFQGESVDCLVNCNGNSRKFWANKNRTEDFKLSVQSVYNSLFDFKFKRYVYVSSMDVYSDNPYGYHKGLAEMLINNETDNYSFLRCSSVIGSGMRKGVVKDIMRGDPVFVHPESSIRIIPNTEVARVVSTVVQQDTKAQILNVGSRTTILVKEIAELFGVAVNYADTLERQMFEYPVDDFGFKTAKEYLLDLKNREGKVNERVE